MKTEAWLQARVDFLEGTLKEAREMVQDWAGYADEYFKTKHNLAGDLAQLDDAIKGGTK